MKKLINKETGLEIATLPEQLPPLKEGYIRLIHQTSFVWAESLAENGLIYNGERAKKSGHCPYADITSMASIYKEDAFWKRLTKDEIRHQKAAAIAIFDMPMEECAAHQNPLIADMLNGTISRGYMVGIIPNYGTKDNHISEKLSISEMEEKKRISKSNPFPPFYETPNWRQEINNAKQTYLEQSKEPRGCSQSRNQDTNDDEFNLISIADINETTSGDDASSKSSQCVYNEKTGKFDYKNSDFQKKLEDNMEKTEDSCSGKVSETHKKNAVIQTETAKSSLLRFKQITRNR